MDKKYEDLQEEIERLIARNRSKWQLTAISWMDYEDVAQIIRRHIYVKWHLWDQSKPFGPWVGRLMQNQIKNQIRNHFGNFAKPCRSCPHHLGGDECNLTKSGQTDEECALYAKWKQKKEKAYNLKLPLSLDPTISIGESCIKEGVDYDKKTHKLHDRVLSKLNSEKHKEIYKMLYIDHKDDTEVAEKFNFKQDKKNRKTPRYKHLNNLKKRFYEMAKAIMQEEDLL